MQQVLAVVVDLILVGSFVVVLCYRIESFSSQLKNEWLDLASVCILQLLVGANVRLSSLVIWLAIDLLYRSHGFSR
jgi:hypothetical protein